MAKTSLLSHVIIMQTTKPHVACARNLGAHACEIWNQALSPLSEDIFGDIPAMPQEFFSIQC